MPTLLLFWLIPVALYLLAGLAGRMSQRKADDAAARWATTRGRVLDVDVVANGNSYIPCVNYTYDVGGREYASDRLRPGGTPFAYSRKGARKTLPDVAAGQAVTVRYDPSRPDIAAIDLRPLGNMQRWLTLMAAIGAGTMTLVTLLTLPPN